MRIALLSDIHDQVWNLRKALAMEALQNTDLMLFCGDLCAPFVLRILAENYSQPIHTVLGNNDGDLAAITTVASRYSQLTVHGEFFRDVIDGRAIAMNHYPEKARLIADAGGYDIVCHGHNHELANSQVGNCLLLNPGPVMGFHGGRLEEVAASFMTVDTATLEVNSLLIKP